MGSWSRGEVVLVEAALLGTYYSRRARHPAQPLALSSVALTPTQPLGLSVTLTPTQPSPAALSVALTLTQPLACSRKLCAYVLVTSACGR